MILILPKRESQHKSEISINFSVYAYMSKNLQMDSTTFSARIMNYNQLTDKHGQETRDYSASFPFLNWRPPLRLIDQLAIYFLVFLC